MNKVEAAAFLAKYETVEGPDKFMYETINSIADENELAGDMVSAIDLRAQAKKHLKTHMCYEVPSDPNSEEFEKFWEALDAD